MTVKDPVTPYGASAPPEPEPEVVSGVPMAAAVPVYDDPPEPYVPGKYSSNTGAGENAPATGTTVMGSTMAQNAPAPTTTTTTTYTIPAGASTNNAGASTSTNPNVPMMAMSMKSTHMTCPHCRQQMATRTRSQIDCCTVVGVIVMVLVFWPLFWIPFLCPCCMTTEHFCTKCHRKIGSAPPCSCND